MFALTFWRQYYPDLDVPAVLGIGERVGITPLGGLVACLYAANPEYVKAKYNLPMLREIENLVAEAVEVNIPFMNPITFVAFPCRCLCSYACFRRCSVDIVRLRIRLEFMPRLS
jgi:hypothetical protein